MKANETPEKIYLQVCGDCPQTDCESCKFEDFEDNITWCKDRIFPKDIEYVRYDAFIEKACNAYCKVCKMTNCRSNECKWISEFKEHLETI